MPSAPTTSSLLLPKRFPHSLENWVFVSFAGITVQALAIRSSPGRDADHNVWLAERADVALAVPSRPAESVGPRL